MKPVAYVVREAIPSYLTNLPIPDTIGGWFSLGVVDYLKLIPPTLIVGGLGYATYKAFYPQKVNTCIKKDLNKVVDTVDIEDLGQQAAFCRCWKSSKWPYCDGSHNVLNKLTGDNTGPLIVKKKEK